MSSTAWVRLSDNAAIEIRPTSSVRRNWPSPIAGSPTRWSSATHTSSKYSSRVSRPRQPMPRIFGPHREALGVPSPRRSSRTPARRRRGHGARQQRDAERHVGARVGDERLAAVDQPAAVAALGARRDAARVGTGVGLGQAERAQRAVPRPAAGASARAGRRCRTGTAAASRSSRAPATRPPPTGRRGRAAPSRRRIRRSTCRCRPTARGSACRAGPARPSRGAGRWGTALRPTHAARAWRSPSARTRGTARPDRVPPR